MAEGLVGARKLAFTGLTDHIGGGRLARDVSLANRVRSGRKQPQRDRAGLRPASHPRPCARSSRRSRTLLYAPRPMDETTGTPLIDEPALPDFLAPSPPPAVNPSYRVLARKYRPRTFGDLIGQDAMVRTLSNAFETGRIPQAWMLTGVRGVGKTTTARILARALNYELPGQGKDGGRPTIRMPELGVHCQAIIDGGHMDVMEIDAASNNGVDNIRQLNDSVRYAPVSARYKVYIVDEVHMLSPGAFNAFLKTLEEPPPHAK